MTKILPAIALFVLTVVSCASEPTEFRRQVGTAGTIRALNLAIEIYRDDRGQPPATLEDLIPDYLIDTRHFRDSWGSKVYYHSNGQNYVLVSFGADRTQDPSNLVAGGLTATSDPSQDIVMIDGQWAQLPKNVDW